VDKFKTIRPYKDSEIQQVLAKHKDSKVFHKLITFIYPSWTMETIANKANQINSLNEFHELLIYPALKAAIDRSMDHFSISGFENIKKDENYLFISNHRDIVLDSTILFYALYQNDYKTGETAIGSNLLVNELVTDIVKLNQNFVVHRNLPTREMIVKSRELSEYMRFVLEEKKKSIWISHREGRTKDGNDKTQVAVLKMLNLSGEKDFWGNFRDINIIPVTISYELESCAVSKVQELYNKMVNPDFKKTKLDDLTSMGKGMETPKGNVHYAFGTPINQLLHRIEHITNRKQRFNVLKELIDCEIYKNYKLSFYNYIAADIYFKTDKYSKFYTSENKKVFNDDFLSSVDKIEGQRDIIEEMFLKIYAIPVENYYNVK